MLSYLYIVLSNRLSHLVDGNFNSEGQVAQDVVELDFQTGASVDGGAGGVVGHLDVVHHLVRRLVDGLRRPAVLENVLAELETRLYNFFFSVTLALA